MTTKEPFSAPRIYVACLAAYNNGKLHGEWIDATQDVEDIREEIQAMLRSGPEPGAEEWAIHDHENFGKVSIDEYEDLERVSRAALLIEEFREVAAEVIDYFGGLRHLDEADEALRERYRGLWADMDDWAENLLQELGDWEKIPENLRNYIDLKSYARDMEISGDIFTIETDRGTHVFDAH
jgi:antirestriction protein